MFCQALSGMSSSFAPFKIKERCRLLQEHLQVLGPIAVAVDLAFATKTRFTAPELAGLLCLASSAGSTLTRSSNG